MPYLRIEYPPGSSEVRLGPARFLPDQDEVWQRVIEHERPPLLSIFRDFSEGEECAPLRRGTLLLAPTDDWLQKHADVAIAALYFLGPQGNQRLAAECFQCYPIRVAKGSSEHGLVALETKRSLLIEEAATFTITPPVAVRGWLNHRVTVNDEPRTALDRLLTDRPGDRLLVAVRQFFRASGDDVFSSLPAEEAALYCAAIEAALNIDSRSDGQKKFVDALVVILGDTSRVREYLNGLYVGRSLHVHGVPNDDKRIDSQSLAALNRFQSLPAGLRVLRRVAYHVISGALGSSRSIIDPFLKDWPPNELRRLVSSDDVWDQGRQLLTATRAADQIAASEPSSKALERLAHLMSEDFEWQHVTAQVAPSAIRKALVTCALLLGRSPDGTAKRLAEELGHAACRYDWTSVRKWLRQTQTWDGNVLDDPDLLKIVAFVARQVAKVVDTRKLDG